ncbi:hypothetical protein CEXT_17271 [Caerostris extrusa]|uniref:Uncharacterized protein n=1 Tax=Caerostris extrusa TaxID=172846 RepID=A0AAV4MEI8_CAEEX|nr:hypothetical protein CEXT_17271 [Caerostris extrusa]
MTEEHKSQGQRGESTLEKNEQLLSVCLGNKTYRTETMMLLRLKQFQNRILLFLGLPKSRDLDEVFD